jgi:cell division protein FtsI/penicillin-binding protein 2
MMDTRGVLRARLITIAALSLAVACLGQPQPAPTRAAAAPTSAAATPTWTAATAHAAQLAPQARIVVIDIATGHLLAASHLQEAARTLAAPGSTLKPLALYTLVAAGKWDPHRRIACDRKLRIAGRSLACSHPPADPMNAAQALAWSCNTYFARLAATLTPGDLRRILAATSLLSQTGLAPDEAVADFRDPRSSDESALTLLGVDNIRVTPLELATAYRWLALQLAANPNSAATQTVQAGLTDSASFGIASAASRGGISVAGKTGTANLGAGTPSHGWFAGLVPSGQPTAVVVVYLPSGHGANAAQVAADLLSHSPAHSPLRQAHP